MSKLLNNTTPWIFLFLTVCSSSLAQQNPSFDQGRLYTLGKIEVTGIKSFSPQTVVAYTGLRTGQQVRIPGDDISAVINKLWKLELFSDINFYLTRVEGDTADIEIYIQELPTLSDFTITGVKKGKLESLIEDTGLKKGLKISENFLETTKNYIINKFRKDGFLNTKVKIETKKDTVGSNSKKMLIYIDRGERVKINAITFEGNDEFKIGADKGSADKTFTRTHQLHGFNDHPFGINGQANGVMDKYNGECQKKETTGQQQDSGSLYIFI